MNVAQGFALAHARTSLTVETVPTAGGFQLTDLKMPYAGHARRKVCNLTLKTLGASHNILKQAKQYAIVSTSFTKDTEHCSQIEFGTLYGMQLS